MTEEEKTNLQKVAIYISCLSTADSMFLGYRNLFLVVETLLFALAIGLLATERVIYLWIPVFLGLIFCLSSFFVLGFGRKRVDYWRDRVLEEVKGTNLQKVFEIYQPVYIWKIPSPTSPRFWFDLASPIILATIWIFLCINYLFLK